MLFSERRDVSLKTALIGGLSATEAQIGTYLSLRAIIQICTMTIFKHALASRIGKGSAVRLYKFGMFAWVLAVSFFPLLSFLARTGKNILPGDTGAVERILGSPVVFDIALVLFFLVMGFGGWCWM